MWIQFIMLLLEIEYSHRIYLFIFSKSTHVLPFSYNIMQLCHAGQAKMPDNIWKTKSQGTVKYFNIILTQFQDSCNLVHPPDSVRK